MAPTRAPDGIFFQQPVQVLALHAVSIEVADNLCSAKREAPSGRRPLTLILTNPWLNRRVRELTICTEMCTRLINAFIVLPAAIHTTRRLIST